MNKLILSTLSVVFLLVLPAHVFAQGEPRIVPAPKSAGEPPKPANAKPEAAAEAGAGAGAGAAAGAEERSEAEEEGEDSTWRVMTHLAGGTLSMTPRGDSNVLDRDYKRGYGAAIGLMADVRPTSVWGLNFGIKFLSMSAEAKTDPDLKLNLSYLAFPLESRWVVAQIRKRSNLYVKGGLTYLVLLDASVDDTDSDGDGDSDWWDDDDWDAYPSPPTEGSRKSHFNKFDVLANVAFGAEFLLFQIGKGFNMAIAPEIAYFHGLTDIGKDGEFGGRIYNQGFLLSGNLYFGF